MFYIVAILFTIASGEGKPLLDQEHPYPSYSACAESIPARLGMFEEHLSKDKPPQVVAFSCVKIKPPETPA